MPAANLSLFGNTAAKQRLVLPEVTLVAVSGVALSPTVASMQRCIEQVEFGRVLLLSDQAPPPGSASEIEWCQIAPVRSKLEYSNFILKHLHKYVATTHMLCVQWDGFVLDASRWSAEFLKYDYIGAPWPHINDIQTVGNGGFSLRSRRLMQACAILEYDGAEAEDLWICLTARRQLESGFGIQFAPVSMAGKFAFERLHATGEEFGFHGVFNMGKVIGATSLAELLTTLESSLIARNELWDLMHWAIRQGEVNLAWQISRRLWRRA